MDLVSVVIPAFNRSAYIGRAVKSVVEQTYAELEVIVVDDCSTDNTVEVVSALADSDRRIALLRHDNNKGAQAARNTGIKAAKGAWIAFLDSDDEWLIDSLAARYKVAMEQNVQVVHSECYVVRYPETSRKLFGVPAISGTVLDKLLGSPGPVFPGLLAKKTALEDIGYLDEEILSFQEWDTSIRLAEHFSFGFVPQPTFVYHCHGDEAISKDRRREALGYERIVEKHKESVRARLGREGMARHYEVIGSFYRNAGEMRTARNFFLKALRHKPWGPFLLWRLKNVIVTFLPT